MNPAPKKEPATQETVAVAAGKKATAADDEDNSKDTSGKPAKPMALVEFHKI